MTIKFIIDNKWIIQFSKLGLSLVFIFAGLIKILNVPAFADSIASYESIPKVFINLIALSLPLFEIILGIMIVSFQSRYVKIASFGIILLNIAFILILIESWGKDEFVDCGCFGMLSIVPVKWKIQVAIVRDIILLFLGTAVYKNITKNSSSK